MKSCAELFWGKQSKALYLMIASVLMLFIFLGSREIWTQEHRWADIVAGMFFRHDFFHPYLNDVNYYDKPLLSYWFIAFFAWLTGQLSTWVLRLPSALAGLLAIYSIYRLGTQLKDKRLGLLAGWMLLTTYYFIFWARTSSADMLNMAGSLFAVAWYFEKKSVPSFFNYAVFFLIMAVTCLCKGLVGAMVPLIAIFPDFIHKKEWNNHLRPAFFLAMIPAAIVYAMPFWASSHFSDQHYAQNGLYLVYRENILRYFQPFDHKDPIYSYFIYLPLYLLPWTFVFVPALLSLKSRWSKMSLNSRWLVWAVFLLFLFFTLSGSRRNYYILPVVPFAILMVADWVLSTASDVTKRNIWSGRLALSALIGMFLMFDVLQPLYYAEDGYQNFATELKSKATEIKPWSAWQFVMLDPESRVRFYLQLAPTVKNYSSPNVANMTTAAMLEAWPVLKNRDPNTILIVRKQYASAIKTLLPNYQLVESKPSLGERVLHVNNKNLPVAFIPMA